MKKIFTIRYLLFSVILLIGITARLNAQTETPENLSSPEQALTDENSIGKQPSAFGEEEKLMDEIYVSTDKEITNKSVHPDRVYSQKNQPVTKLGVEKPFDRKLDKVFTKISKITGIDMTSTAQEDIGGIELFSLLGFILGILALFSFYGAFLLGVLGLIFSIMGMKRAPKGSTSRIFAIIGLICSILALLGWAAYYSV